MSFVNVKDAALRRYEKAAALASAGVVALMTGPGVYAAGLDDLFDEIDLAGVATKVTAIAVLIVGIAFVIKGPAIVKRLVGKI